MSAATGEVVELTTQQRRDHDADEKVIAAGLATFVEVGRALVRIRDRRSYLLTHSTFGGYVRDRWRFNAPYAYNLMAGAEVIDVLERADVDVRPANARVAYELRELVDRPDELVKVWQRAVDEYGERPIALEVARMIRGPVPPKRAQLQQSSNGRAEPASSDEAALYGRAIVDACDAVEAAKSVQRVALVKPSRDELELWARQVKMLRTMAQDLQRAIERKR